MLEIALAPAPVAVHEVAERRRELLVTAAELGRQPHAPSGPAQEGGLDEIVAQDLAAERRRREAGQGGARRESVEYG